MATVVILSFIFALSSWALFAVAKAVTRKERRKLSPKELAEQLMKAARNLCSE